MAAILPAWIKKYGEEEAYKKWEEYKKSCKRDTAYYENKYSKEYVKNLNKKKTSFTEEYYINKYGEAEGREKWKEVLQKKLNTQKENYKDKKWKNGRTLEEYQIRYGIDEGYKKWKIRNDNQSYKTSLQRYIQEFGESGIEICRKIKDTTSLDFCKRKFGEEEGVLRYNKKVKNSKISSKRCIDYWLIYHDEDIEKAKESLKDHQSRRLEYFIKKYGKDIGLEKYQNFIKLSTSSSGFYSKISQELFWELYNLLSLSEENTNFYELNEEQLFYKDNSIIRVDFKYKNKIIEFNGDYWHGNPTKYKESDRVRNSNVEDIWKRDASRLDFLNRSGYSTLVVWEDEWKNNRELIIEKCKNYILDEKT